MDMKEKAFGYIDEHRDGMMKMWEELVMMDSGSGNKPGVDAIVAKVAGILEGMGGKTRIIEHENAGNMLVSEFGDCKNKTRKPPKNAPLPLKTALLTARARWI